VVKFLVMWEYNVARYDVYPLAEMETPADVLREQGGR
jgi:hypothetical protein